MPRRPEPPPPGAAVRETHTGIVVLAGDHAYKAKKPVSTSFCDFGTADRRRAALDAELELNRRLAPDVYLGVGTFRPPGTDQREEPVLVMRRMPDDRRLSTRILRDEPVDDDLREIARTVAAFHAGAGRSPAIDADAGADGLARRWRANLADLAAFEDGPLDRARVRAVERLSHEFVAGRAALFRTRAAAGRFLDGHGDLLADDVFCLDDGPRLLDCLDFDPALRHVDGLDDIAFLAMDLERLGDAEGALRLLDWYREFGGDPAPPSLCHHYVAYRATVRAKVACLRLAQGDPDSGNAARRLLDLAVDHLRAGAVRLALIGGLPGTGKSTVAAALADRTGAVLLSTDRIRKELSGIDPYAAAGTAYGTGLYRPDRTTGVYRAVLERARMLLELGESVVVDASWIHDDVRAAARATAGRAGARLVELRCEVGAEEAIRRLGARGPTASDADATVAARMAADADPWPEATPVGTSGTVERSCDDAVAAWWDATADAPGAPAVAPTAAAGDVAR